MIRVLLADDQPLFLDALRQTLEQEQDIEIVATALNGAQAVRLAEQHDPDIILMDVEMPTLDGVEATWSIVQDRSMRSKIILFTTFDYDEYVFKGLKAGAVGFLLKVCGKDELLRAIRLTMEGKSWLDPAISGKIVAAINRHPSPQLDNTNPLSDRDLSILRLIAMGTSNREIGERLGYAEGSIKRYASELMAKLGASDRAHAVAIAKDRGLI